MFEPGRQFHPRTQLPINAQTGQVRIRTNCGSLEVFTFSDYSALIADPCKSGFVARVI